MSDVTTTPAVPNGNGGALAQRSAYNTRITDVWKMAEGLSRSDLVPAHFQGKPANCFLALQIAERGDLDIFAVLTNLFVVKGTPGFSAKFLIGLANIRGPFRGPLRYRTTQKPLAVTCYGIYRDTGEEAATTVTMAQAEAAGWTKNPKYREMPEQMLSYRAATFLIRLACPEVAIMGARTIDELEDMHAAGVGPAPDFRDAMPIQRADPLSRAIETESTVAAQPQRVEAEGESVSGGLAAGQGGGVSPFPGDERSVDEP